MIRFLYDHQNVSLLNMTFFRLSVLKSIDEFKPVSTLSEIELLWDRDSRLTVGSGSTGFSTSFSRSISLLSSFGLTSGTVGETGFSSLIFCSFFLLVSLVGFLSILTGFLFSFSTLLRGEFFLVLIGWGGSGVDLGGGVATFFDSWARTIGLLGAGGADFRVIFFSALAVREGAFFTSGVATFRTGAGRGRVGAPSGSPLGDAVQPSLDDWRLRAFGVTRPDWKVVENYR